MPKDSESELIGKIVFYATLAAMLVFFWWFLIQDHGGVAAH